MTDFLINFAVNLDPNNKTDPIQEWPKYTTSSPQLLTFLDGTVPFGLINDTYREEAMEFGIQVLLDYPM